MTKETEPRLVKGSIKFMPTKGPMAAKIKQKTREVTGVPYSACSLAKIFGIKLFFAIDWISLADAINIPFQVEKSPAKVPIIINLERM